MERKSSYVGTDIGIKLLPAVGVSLLSKTHSHSSCSTVMALLCILVSELVSCTFSTIPILCPFLIQFTWKHANFPVVSFLRCVTQYDSTGYIGMTVVVSIKCVHHFPFN